MDSIKYKVMSNIEFESDFISSYPHLHLLYLSPSSSLSSIQLSISYHTRWIFYSGIDKILLNSPSYLNQKISITLFHLDRVEYRIFHRIRRKIVNPTHPFICSNLSLYRWASIPWSITNQVQARPGPFRSTQINMNKRNEIMQISTVHGKALPQQNLRNFCICSNKKLKFVSFGYLWEDTSVLKDFILNNNSIKYMIISI